MYWTGKRFSRFPIKMLHVPWLVHPWIRKLFHCSGIPITTHLLFRNSEIHVETLHICLIVRCSYQNQAIFLGVVLSITPLSLRSNKGCKFHQVFELSPEDFKYCLNCSCEQNAKRCGGTIEVRWEGSELACLQLPCSSSLNKRIKCIQHVWGEGRCQLPLTSCPSIASTSLLQMSHCKARLNSWGVPHIDIRNEWYFPPLSRTKGKTISTISLGKKQTRTTGNDKKLTLQSYLKMILKLLRGTSWEISWFSNNNKKVVNTALNT